LADKAIELGFCESISRDGWRGAEKLSPTAPPTFVVHRAITGEYLTAMEDLLHLYSLPYNEHLPIVCFDELPVQLLGEVVTPLPMKAGQPNALIMNTRVRGVARCSWPLSL
jgi:hypothetical protein